MNLQFEQKKNEKRIVEKFKYSLFQKIETKLHAIISYIHVFGITI